MNPKQSVDKLELVIAKDEITPIKDHPVKLEIVNDTEMTNEEVKKQQRAKEIMERIKKMNETTNKVSP